MVSTRALGGIGRAFANRNFRYYFLGMSASTSGFWASRVALSWLVWELTHSPAWLGIMVFVEVVPMIVLGPIGGTVVDRKGSLRVARVMQVGWACVMCAFAAVILLGAASKAVLLVIVFAGGVVAGFSNPSQLALVARLTPREDLAAAVALQSFVVQTGRFVGPAIAGPLLATVGAGFVFALVAGCYVWSAVTLFMISTLVPETSAANARSFVGDFMDGVRYTLDHFAIRTIIVYTAIMAVLLRPVVELLPGFVERVFARDAGGLALLMAAFGLGSVISALHIAFRGETRGLTRVFTINLFVGAVSLLAFALVADFRIALALTAIFGMSTNTVSIVSQTLAQNMVAGGMRARVMSILGMTFRAVPAGGALVQGWAQSQFGLAGPVAAAAAICLIAWVRLVQTARKRNLAREAERAGDQATMN